ncbi:hybrid sensor histidine kinase/response regulator transcription factor [Alkalitalea saponilacus]|uniref:histidine kinase n=1 Tax=Alkalitalea saponilacus TaxID=889453 RepID=A0A1T5F994_9BACT|nr:hybrid sensor histidine kinase/response regulator transcription factor [Alkalitalea saponilacus]ASB50115.1 ATPase [Alkalitalea saponilacus]SKB92690.1 Signal transduction histidine kinase [Alkalitalea saponilacus]
MKRGCISLFLIFLFLQHLFPNKILDFDSYSIEDGFSSSKANAIIQDRKGFIWIGTWNGLTRFDGYNTVVYTSGIEEHGVISNREIVSLCEDDQGNIWIGTSSGLNRLNPETGNIDIYDFESRILSIYQDSRGDIWVGTWDEGLVRLNPETGQRDTFLEYNVISDIIEDEHNDFWIATYQGLVLFDRDSETYLRYTTNTDAPSTSIIHSVLTSLATSNDGALWIGFWGGGVSKMSRDSLTRAFSFQHFQVREGEGSMSSNEVYRLHYDEYGNLWIGTWDAGLILFEEEQQIKSPQEAFFHNFEHDLNNRYSLSGNNISALFVDRSGILWVSGALIDRANVLKTSGITRYSTTEIQDGRAIENAVRSIAGDSIGNLWVGTSRSLKYFRRSTETYQLISSLENLSYHFNGNLFESNSVLALECFDQGLLVGTDDAGLLFFTKNELDRFPNSRFQFVNNQTNLALPGNKVDIITASKKYPGEFWIGTLQTGFARLSIKNNVISEIRNYQTYNSGLSDNNIRDIIEDKNGFVWIATQRGLNRFDPETEDFINFYSVRGDASTINDNIINVLLEDSLGNLWIATNSGLNKKVVNVLSDGTEVISFKRFPAQRFVSSELITNAFLDSEGDLWLGLYEGMVKFSVIDQTVIDYFQMREYQRVGVERNSAFRTYDGEIIIGGGYGFITFYPENLHFLSMPPEVTFTDIQIFNTSISNMVTNGERRFNKSVPYMNDLRLSYSDRVLTFVFSAMDYMDPQRNTYAYILEGFDDDWNLVGERNTATYTNIPDGEYVLKVLAANSDGVWAEEPAILNITITPPWWKTTWAFSVYIFIILILLYFFQKYSIIQVKEKSNLFLEKIQREKEQELYDLKVRFFTNITHEFRTPLTLILGPVEEILSKSKVSVDIEKSLKLVHRNTHRLLRLVNQLMEFRKVDRGKMELFLQKENIIPILDDLYDSFLPLAEAKKIYLEVNYSPAEIIAWVDRDKLEKVLFNLLSNAVKFTENNGHISLNAGIEKDDENQIEHLYIEVIDDGIGIADVNKNQIFERFFQVDEKRSKSTGGIGLYLAKAFVDLHQGKIDLISEPGKGSCFRVAIPTDLGTTPEFIRDVIQKSTEMNVSDDAFVESGIGIQAKGKNADVDLSVKKSKSISKNKPVALVVEDDEDLNTFICDGLQEFFNVISTIDGKQGLEYAKKNNPDIIISDIMMPEMDGFEMCRELRDDINTSHIPVVFLTAKTMQEDEIKGLRLGAVDYIFKPFNMESLRLKLLNILENISILQNRFRTDAILEPDVESLSSLDEEFLKNAVAAVDEQLDNPSFDVEKLSEKLRLTPNQTYRKIKALTGYTAKEFIRIHRLKTAAQLLIQRKRNISEIIYMVGFSSPSYFSRCFRDFFGCTPSEYIEKENDEFEDQSIEE